ncbi:formylglycine-generating enzyme family protein [Sphaerotilaceae bacterium SBD11-9]
MPMPLFSFPRPALLAAAIMASLMACKGQAQDSSKPSPETEAKVKTLVDKTLANLRRIEGGSIWLGDFGVLMSDADKANNTPPGPNAKPGAGLPFTADPDNKPPRWVTLDTFYLSAYKVTYGDFDAYVQANGLPAHPPQTEDVAWQRIWRKMRTSDDVPAGVHWDQAKAYCHWLGKLTGLPFDLPTEAQWEFAAGNGKNSRKHPYPTASGLLEEGKAHPTYEQMKALTKRTSRVYPIGRFAPSPNGLYDLMGNGFDWVNDWYGPDGYHAGAAHNPSGPAGGSLKVLRGYPTNEDWVDFGYLTRRKLLPNNERFLDEDGDTPSVYGNQGIRCAVNASSLNNHIQPPNAASQATLPVADKPSPSIAK